MLCRTFEHPASFIWNAFAHCALHPASSCLSSQSDDLSFPNTPPPAPRLARVGCPCRVLLVYTFTGDRDCIFPSLDCGDLGQCRYTVWQMTICRINKSAILIYIIKKLTWDQGRSWIPRQMLSTAYSLYFPLKMLLIHSKNNIWMPISRYYSRSLGYTVVNKTRISTMLELNILTRTVTPDITNKLVRW